MYRYSPYLCGMFIKVTKSKNYNYLQIVESYREGSNTRHRVIANLGRYDELQGNEQIMRLANRLLKIAGQDPEELQFEELQRLHYGHKVYENIWNKFNLNKILTNCSRNDRIKFDFKSIVFYMVVQRLLNPGSKYAGWQNQNNYLDIANNIPLHQFYRCLDVLAKRKDIIEKHLFNRHRTLFNMKVDVVFYDVTTFYFESVVADDLKNFGFGKDGKAGEVQVVMGLLIDSEGRPIGHELFPGNTSEGKTMVEALESLKTRFSIRRLIIVADKGLNSGTQPPSYQTGRL